MRKKSNKSNSVIRFKNESWKDNGANSLNWGLELEKQRLQRVSGPVYFVYFDIDKISNNLKNTTYEKVLSSFMSNVRESDRLFKSNRQIKLVLTNSSKDGAYSASKRLTTVIHKTLNGKSFFNDDPKWIEIQAPTWNDKTKLSPAMDGSEIKNDLRNPISLEKKPDIEQGETLGNGRVSQNGNTFGLRIKRLVDITGALIAIIGLLPFMILIAIAIKISSRGPILFIQKRVGFRGKLFWFYKFRSMFENADDAIHREYITKLIRGTVRKSNSIRRNTPLYKLEKDRRITKVGKILRNWSLDELPQLFNVIKGDMSLVGPRPAIPYEVERYDAWYLHRLETLPGLTGLWQIKGRSRTTFIEMVRFDIQYIRNWSLWLDFKIILHTFKAVASREGAL